MEEPDESRTVVVSGVPKVLPISRMIDKLTIHFQRRRNHGGDVEVVWYPTKMDGVAFVTFDDPKDAERVVRKKEHIMMDDELASGFLLTVFPFTRDVYLYVSRAVVDLSLFGRDQESLIQSLRSAHRSLRFLPLLKHQKATIEGPFTAVQALKHDLIRRANHLKSTDSAQAASLQTPETPLNPRVISHRKPLDSVSCGASKAKPEPVHSLSTGLQTTGGVQSPLLNAKTSKDSSRLKVQERGLAEGGFLDTNSDEEEEVGSGSRVKMPTVFKERTIAGITSSLSDYDRPSVAEMLRRGEDILQNHSRKDRKKRTREENHLNHDLSTTSSEELDQSSLAAAANILQNSFKDPSKSSDDSEENGIWVDLNTFRYIKKFDKKALDECLRGFNTEYVKGSDLVRVILTEKQASMANTGVQQALKNLQALVEARSLTLRVHEIDLNEEGQTDQQKVIQICKEVNFIYDDVLFMFEGSHIKVIGPSSSSYLFCMMAKRKLSPLYEELKGTFM